MYSSDLPDAAFATCTGRALRPRLPRRAPSQALRRLDHEVRRGAGPDERRAQVADAQDLKPRPVRDRLRTESAGAQQ